MTGTPTVYTGEDASLWISGLSHSTLAISDFSLTLGADIAEQPLVGEKGNFRMRGALSAEGSLTSCKLHSTAVGKIIGNMIDGEHVKISGSCGTNSLHFYFASTQITGFDFTLGTAGDICIHIGYLVFQQLKELILMLYISLMLDILEINIIN